MGRLSGSISSDTVRRYWLDIYLIEPLSTQLLTLEKLSKCPMEPFDASRTNGGSAVNLAQATTTSQFLQHTFYALEIVAIT